MPLLVSFCATVQVLHGIQLDYVVHHMLVVTSRRVITFDYAVGWLSIAILSLLSPFRISETRWYRQQKRNIFQWFLLLVILTVLCVFSLFVCVAFRGGLLVCVERND